MLCIPLAFELSHCPLSLEVELSNLIVGVLERAGQIQLLFLDCSFLEIKYPGRALVNTKI